MCGHEHDAVPRRNPEQRDEPDERRHREHAAGEEHAATPPMSASGRFTMTIRASRTGRTRARAAWRPPRARARQVPATAATHSARSRTDRRIPRNTRPAAAPTATRPPDVGHDAPKVPARHVGGDDDLALHVLPRDLVRALLRRTSASALTGASRHPACRRGGWRCVRGHRRRPRRTSRSGRTQSPGRRSGQTVCPPGSFRRSRRRRRAQPVSRDRRPVQHEPHKRDVRLLFDRQVHDARHPEAASGSHPFAERAQSAQVVAEHFDGDVRARARQHVVNPVRRSAGRSSRSSRGRRELPPQLRQEDLAGPRRRTQAHVELRGLDPLDVLVVFRAACASSVASLRAATGGCSRRGGRSRWIATATFRAA